MKNKRIMDKTIITLIGLFGLVMSMIGVAEARQATLGSDLLVAQNLYWTHSGNVALLLNQGNLTFTQSLINTRLGIGPIRVADFNNDGNDDFVASHQGGEVYVGLGDGNGGFAVSDAGFFTRAQMEWTGERKKQGASSIKIADVNNDGVLDLLFAVSGWYASVNVALGDGTGGFSLVAVLDTWGGTRQIDSGDIDGDGFVDLVTANAQGSHALEVFWGDGSGTNWIRETVDTNTGTIGVAIVDIDGDGNMDVVTGGLGGGWSPALSVYRGDGTRTLGPREGYWPNVFGFLHLLSDFNGDGYLDAVTTGTSAVAGEYHLAVYYNNGSGQFTSAPLTYALPNSYVLCGGCDVTLGDFNEDGVKDLAVANGSSGTVSILLGDGAGAFQQPVSIGGLTRTVSIAAGNFDAVANQPPVAEADFTPVDVEEDEGLFEVVATATDPDDNLDTVTAIIELPSIDGLDTKLKEKNKVKVEIDLDEGKVKIEGPDPDALLAEILQYGGFLVEDGDLVKAEPKEHLKYELKLKKGVLKIEAPEITLRVTATDTEGLTDTATASPVFTPENDDDSHDDHHDNDGHHDNNDHHDNDGHHHHDDDE
jgi:hypothetical protein